MGSELHCNQVSVSGSRIELEQPSKVRRLKLGEGRRYGTEHFDRRR